MRRSRIREEIFKIIFRLDFYTSEDMARQVDLSLDGMGNERDDHTADFEGGTSDLGRGTTDSERRTADSERRAAGSERRAAGSERGTERQLAYIRDKALDILARKAQLDAMIDEGTFGWSSGRMGKAELAIIRLALYEMCFEDQVPVSVSINEAVELAKRYGSETSAGFVNGVLARFTETGGAKTRPHG